MHCKIISPNNDIYKLPFIPDTFQELSQIILNKLNLKKEEHLKLKYKDIDEELITLSCQEDLKTAVLTCQDENIKCLKVYVYESHLPQSFLDQSVVNSFVNIQPKGSKIFVETLKRSKENFMGRKVQSDKLSKGMTQESIQKMKRSFFANDLFRIPLKQERNGLKRFHPFSAPTQSSSQNLFSPNVIISNKVHKNKISKEDDLCSVCSNAVKKIKFICLECSNKIYCEKCEVTAAHIHPLLKVRSHTEQNREKTEIQKEVKTNFVNLSLEAEKRNSSKGSAKKVQHKAKFDLKFCHKPLTFQVGEICKFKIAIKNSGEQNWPDQVKLICINGSHKGQTKEIPSLQSKEKWTGELSLEAPKTPAKQLSQWRLHHDEDGVLRGFGISFFIKTNIVLEKAEKKTEREERKIKETDDLMDEEWPTPFEAKEPRRLVYTQAEALNDMFPGDLEAKIRFVQNCPAYYTIYEIVDRYLQTIGKSLKKRSVGVKNECILSD